MKNSETPIEMELGIEPVKPNNQDKPIYRQRKRYIYIKISQKIWKNLYKHFTRPSSSTW